MAGAIDLFLLYQFIKKLATPFNEWEAYDLGVIDEKGNILKDAKERRKSIKEREAFGKFDLLVLKLKKLLEKIPGGQTRLGSYAAALWLIKEHQEKGTDTLTEDSLTQYMNLAESMGINERFEKEFGEEIANAVGRGGIAGIGFGPDGEPGVTPKQMKRYKDKNKKNAPKKRLRDII